MLYLRGKIKSISLIFQQIEFFFNFIIVMYTNPNPDRICFLPPKNPISSIESYSIFP